MADRAGGRANQPLGPAVAERLLRLAAYLKWNASGGDHVTLERITEDLPDYHDLGYEAARKKLRRDLAELESSFGIAVDVSDTGEYRLPPPFLTAEQRRAVFAAVATVHVDDEIDLAPGDLAAGVDDSAATVALHVHEAVRELRDAIAARRAVTFVHAGKPREVEPWAVGHWKRRWYLLGHDRDHDEERRFRLDRIEEHDGDLIAPFGEPDAFGIPDSLDVTKTFDLHPDAWGGDPPVRARVLVEPDRALPLATRLQGVVTETGDDGCVVEAEVRNYEAFVDRVLEAREHARVLEPDVLVERITTHLRAVATT